MVIFLYYSFNIYNFILDIVSIADLFVITILLNYAYDNYLINFVLNMQSVSFLYTEIFEKDFL